jgi:hypothetical protein
LCKQLDVLGKVPVCYAGSIKTYTRQEPDTQLPSIEDDERYAGQADDFIARNREVLNRSFRGSRRQVVEGKVLTMSLDDTIMEGRSRRADL